MKSPHKLHLYLLILVLLVVVAACGSSKQPDPTATPIPPIEPTLEIVEPSPPPTATEIPPTEVPPTPTEIPPTPTEIPPTATPIPSPTSIPPTPTNVPPSPTPLPTEPESVPYYVEEFDVSPDNWSWFTMSGDENLMDVYTEDGYLVFDLQGENQWVYLLYDDYIYEDVYLEAMADNRGKNDNNVSLVCRYSDEEGWYEFNVTNGGLYQILVYSQADEEYYLLADGGSTKVNSGRATNIYSAVCYGNLLQLYINGELEREVTDNKYNLIEGQVGVSVSSFTTLPVLVEFDYVWIDTPY